MRFCSALLLIFFIGLLTTPSVGQAHRGSTDRIAEVSFRIAVVPGSTELLLQRSELYRQAQEWTRAEADLRLAKRIDPDHEEVAWLLGRLYLESGRPHQAQFVLDEFLAGSPEHISALVTRARSLLQLGEPLSAVADFAAALRLRPDSGPTLYLEMADAYAEAGDEFLVDALRVLNEATALIGKLMVFESRACELELDLGLHASAIDRVDRILTTLPWAEKWHFKRGELLRKAGRKIEAHQSFKRALELLEADPDGLHRSAQKRELALKLRQRLSRQGQADASLSRAVSIAPAGEL